MIVAPTRGRVERVGLDEGVVLVSISDEGREDILCGMMGSPPGDEYRASSW